MCLPSGDRRTAVHVQVARVLDLPVLAVVVYQCGDLGGLWGMI
jgi:hypothetical protein